MEEPQDGIRTSEEKLAGMVTFHFGGVEFRLKVPVRRETGEWLKKYEQHLRTQQEKLNQQKAGPGDFVEELIVMIKSGDEIPNLVYAWPGIEAIREQIDEIGTAADFSVALQEMILIANPTLAAAAMMQLAASRPSSAPPRIEIETDMMALP